MKRDDIAYFEDPEFQELLKRYEQSLEQGETIYMDAADLTDIAEYYMIHNEEDKANLCIALAVELHPDAVDPQVFLARQHLFYDDIPAAYAILNSISNACDDEVVFLHAEILLKDGKPQEATQMLLEFMKGVPKDELADYYYDTADIFCDYGYYSEALAWANTLIKKFPPTPNAKLMLADILVRLDRFDEALACAEEVVNKDAFNQGAWMLMTDVYAMQEKYKEALEASEYLLAINEKHPAALLARARCLFFLNRIEESHEAYQHYLSIHPNEYLALYLDSISLTNMSKFEDAKVELQRALELCHPNEPELPHMHHQLAYVLSKLSDLDGALQELEKCRNCIVPDSDINYELTKGHFYLENGYELEARNYFDEAIMKSNSPLETLLLIAVSYGESGIYSTAAELFQNIYDSDLDQAKEKTSPYLAFCHYNLYHKEQFLHYLKEAVELNPQITEYLFQVCYPDVPVEKYVETALKEKWEKN